MKELLLLLCSSLISLGLFAQSSASALRQWKDNKYSMLIHFDSCSVENRRLSDRLFNPVHFNADSIAATAKRAGMRTIVFTAKHFDGFCLFQTNTTDFNSHDTGPYRHDLVKEMSEACRKTGLNFGLYFPLTEQIVSTSEDNFITKERHECNKVQVEELLTRYGSVSEIWFDMGSNTPEQSMELYELVHRLQPSCMTSEGLGNDRYDFCVMESNGHDALQAPWQTCANAYIGAKELMASLASAVSHGGNVLYDICLDKQGNIVPAELQLLEDVGRWLRHYSYAIYESMPSPFSEEFQWGEVTRNEERLYIFLSGKYPKNGKITFSMPGYTLKKGDGKMATYLQYGDEIILTVPASAYKDKMIHVLTLEFDKRIMPIPGNSVKSAVLTSQNATPLNSHSRFDRHSKYKSTIGYTWNFDQLLLKQLDLVYTQQETGKVIDLTIDGETYIITLEKERPQNMSPLPGTEWGDLYLYGPENHPFDTPSIADNASELREGWKKLAADSGSIDCKCLDNYYLTQEIESPRSQRIMVEIGAGNGIEVCLNGSSIMKHLNPYRCTFRKEKVILPLKKGKNRLTVRLFNRFEEQMSYLIRPADSHVTYRKEVTLPEMLNGKYHTVTVKPHNPASPHTDAELYNLRIRLRRIAM